MYHHSLTLPISPPSHSPSITDHLDSIILPHTPNVSLTHSPSPFHLPLILLQLQVTLTVLYYHTHLMYHHSLTLPISPPSHSPSITDHLDSIILPHTPNVSLTHSPSPFHLPLILLQLQVTLTVLYYHTHLMYHHSLTLPISPPSSLLPLILLQLQVTLTVLYYHTHLMYHHSLTLPFSFNYSIILPHTPNVASLTHPSISPPSHSPLILLSLPLPPSLPPSLLR